MVDADTPAVGGSEPETLSVTEAPTLAASSTPQNDGEAEDTAVYEICIDLTKDDMVAGVSENVSTLTGSATVEEPAVTKEAPRRSGRNTAGRTSSQPLQ